MELFEQANRERLHEEAPLATRMRPRTLDEVIGQQHLLGPGKPLRRAIEANRLFSVIFFGPPGCGKTTLARLMAAATGAEFVAINAVTSGVTEVRKLIAEAHERRVLHGRRTVLFIDEIHRFNKAQQDALLAAVEEGTVILIGATTENPMTEVISPLLSRARLFRLEPLSADEVRWVIERALRDPERGLGWRRVTIDPEAMEHLVRTSNGDARAALSALEWAALTTPPMPFDGREEVRITLEAAEQATQQRWLPYDRAGDHHYDIISAFIKSMRGSDPDATLYWLARMLYAGEDPRFIARRILIHAAEDVGLADPQALVVAAAAATALEWVGMPEGRIPLAQAALYVATAPKSNAVVTGIGRAWDDVQHGRLGPVPPHLRDAHYPGAAALGHGAGYRYPHDFPGNHVPQQYLPDGLQERRYFEPGENGFEQVVRARLARWRGEPAG